MLLGMLLHWIIDTHRRYYPSMPEGTKIAFISDVGAQSLKPLFITGSVLTTVFLDLSFLATRWLRHSGRLAPNKSWGEKVLDILTIVFGLIGTAGLILLSIFDTYRHNKLHDIFLLLFMGGYLISAIFICWEYQRLGIKYREHVVLRASFWIKLSFILIEFFLACVFAGTTFTHHHDVTAVFEWTIAFVFTFYILSFALDLYPAVYTRSYSQRFSKEAEAPSPVDAEAATQSSA